MVELEYIRLLDMFYDVIEHYDSICQTKSLILPRSNVYLFIDLPKDPTSYVPEQTIQLIGYPRKSTPLLAHVTGLLLQKFKKKHVGCFSRPDQVIRKRLFNDHMMPYDPENLEHLLAEYVQIPIFN